MKIHINVTGSIERFDGANMKLTLFTDYSIRVLLYLAARPDRRCSIAEIARAYRISQNHLMKVVNDLARSGYVDSIRGRGGGIRLGKLPEEINIDKLLRALIAVTLFEAAYVAEVVRGGMQAIPKGQYEAAAAMGLGYWRMMGLVILPQALKLVIPGIVNTFIALFKDTSLVIIIGLFDLFNSIHQATVDPAWLGFATEGYVFAALMFWIFCFSMSRYSMRLERKLDTGHKR